VSIATDFGETAFPLTQKSDTWKSRFSEAIAPLKELQKKFGFTPEKYYSGGQRADR
jgi:hypothetical protein